MGTLAAPGSEDGVEPKDGEPDEDAVICGEATTGGDDVDVVADPLAGVSAWARATGVAANTTTNAAIAANDVRLHAGRIFSTERLSMTASSYPARLSDMTRLNKERR